MSDSPTASAHDLSAAIAALTAELDDRLSDYGDHIHPILSHLTMGHLRALAAALADVHIPGMRPMDRAEFWKATGRTAMVTVWANAGDYNGTATYFAAVQS